MKKFLTLFLCLSFQNNIHAAAQAETDQDTAVSIEKRIYSLQQQKTSMILMHHSFRQFDENGKNIPHSEEKNQIFENNILALEAKIEEQKSIKK